MSGRSGGAAPGERRTGKKALLAAVLAAAGYYLLLAAVFGALAVFDFIDGVILPYSAVLHFMLFIGLPVLLALLPAALRLFGRMSFLRAAGKSAVAALLCGVLILGVRTGIRIRMSSFSPSKWQRCPELRYLMVDDLEKEHGLIGMTQDEVKALLGTGDGWMPFGTYYIRDLFFKREYYVLEFDENGTVTATRTRAD